MNTATTTNCCCATDEPGKTATQAAANPSNVVSEAKWHWHETLADGTRVLIRPIHKEDGPLERAFIDRLSPESRSYRFLGQVKTDGDLVRKMTDVDLLHDMAFVALRHDDGEKLEIGVSRYYVSADGQSCE